MRAVNNGCSSIFIQAIYNTSTRNICEIIFCKIIEEGGNGKVSRYHWIRHIKDKNTM